MAHTRCAHIHTQDESKVHIKSEMLRCGIFTQVLSLHITLSQYCRIFTFHNASFVWTPASLAYYQNATTLCVCNLGDSMGALRNFLFSERMVRQLRTRHKDRVGSDYMSLKLSQNIHLLPQF